MNLISAPINVAIDIYEYCCTNCLECCIYNYTTYYEGFPRINLEPDFISIYSTIGIQDMYHPDFYKYYRDGIFSNWDTQLEFYSKITEPLFNGSVVIILTNGSSECEYLTECLITIIKERYDFLGDLSAETLMDFVDTENENRTFTTKSGIERALYDINIMNSLKIQKGTLNEVVDWNGNSYYVDTLTGKEYRDDRLS